MLMLAVIDANILVSALWSRNGSPAKVLSLVLNGKVIPCIDSRIMHEYRAVLSRPQFGFTGHEIDALLSWFEDYGFSVVPEPLEDAFIDEADKKFYEVAKHCGAVLVTGNLKHFPSDPQIVNAATFLEMVQK